MLTGSASVLELAKILSKIKIYLNTRYSPVVND